MGLNKAWEAIAPLNEIRHFTDWDKRHPSTTATTNPSLKASFLWRISKKPQSSRRICLPIKWPQHCVKTSFFAVLRPRILSKPPCLVLEGGHWCDRCERESWNYYERAKRDPFFAQVWTPLHPADEPARVYPKIVSELDVKE
jgi:hypothetical protein